MSEPGHSSRRAYEPIATSAHGDVPRSPVAARSVSSTSSASARAERLAPELVIGDELLARDARVAAHRRLALQRVGPRLAGADAPDVLDRHDPHLAVADLARCSRW